jgi:hypothetical protein
MAARHVAPDNYQTRTYHAARRAVRRGGSTVLKGSLAFGKVTAQCCRPAIVSTGGAE